jgi:hypothetical protein
MVECRYQLQVQVHIEDTCRSNRKVLTTLYPYNIKDSTRKRQLRPNRQNRPTRSSISTRQRSGQKKKRVFNSYGPGLLSWPKRDSSRIWDLYDLDRSPFRCTNPNP